MLGEAPGDVGNADRIVTAHYKYIDLTCHVSKGEMCHNGLELDCR